MNTINETDYENRFKAIRCLEKAKCNEQKKNLIPLRLHDENNTVVLVSSRLSQRQREKLKQKKLQQINQRRVQELIE